MIRPRWQRRREARPAELLEQALVCFAELGFEATTLDRIAQRAGVTKGTIYHYFSGKEDLLDHLIADLAVPAVRTLNEVASATAGTPAERLEAVMRHHWKLLTTTSVGLIPRLIVNEIHRHPELISRLFAEVGQHVFGLYAGIVAHGTAGGVFRAIDPLQAAQLIALPMVGRTLLGGQPEVAGLLGGPDAFIDTHCAAAHRWLAAEEVP